MDDAQGIVLLALQRAGVELPDDVHSVGELQPKQLLPIYNHALTLLRGSPLPNLPSEFPQQRAERFRVCADLVAAFQQLGYRGELSFHQFLYPSEADTHRLLRFLLDKLSQTGARGRGVRKGRAAGRVDDFSGSKISGTVRQALTACWEEAVSSGSSAEAKDRIDESQLSVLGGFGVRESGSVGKVEVAGVPFRACPLRLASQPGKKQPRLITLQAKPRSWLVPSVLEHNARSAEKAARLMDAQLADLARHGDWLGQDGSSTGRRVITYGMLSLTGERSGEKIRSEGKKLDKRPGLPDDELLLSEGKEASRKAEIVTLEKELYTLTEDADALKREVDVLRAKALDLEKESKVGSERVSRLEDKRLVTETAVGLALDASRPPEEVLQELEVVVKESDEHLLGLHDEWETYRTRLEERVAEAGKTYEARNSEANSKLLKMKEMRQEMKDLSAKLWARESEEAQLLTEVDKLEKGASRATYVRRITELIRNSKKQDADIARIIADTRELQRESNTSQDKLRRLHALVDEIVFRDAKKDPICRQAYRLLSGLHTNFESIVDRILEMDKLGREVSELQAKLEELEKRPLDAASVEADLQAITSETRLLEKKLAELEVLSHEHQ